MKISANYTKPNILIISGATASGKTKWSIQIAKSIIASGHKAAIINFDSLLFYSELSIGTAKPSSEDMQEVPHYLINICSAKNKINASTFRQTALDIINKIYKDTTILLVGGSGFYLRSLIKGMYSQSQKQLSQNKDQELYHLNGIDSFRSYLKKYDPKSFEMFHENDHYRIIRAYQYHQQTGASYALKKLAQDKNLPYDFSIKNAVDWNIEQFYLAIPKVEHWEIIKKRTKLMIELGLIEEVENLLQCGFDGTEQPLNSIGYKETVAYLQGTVKTKDELIEQIYISTRQLAKSQKTFFKKITPKKVFNPLIDLIPHF